VFLAIFVTVADDCNSYRQLDPYIW